MVGFDNLSLNSDYLTINILLSKTGYVIIYEAAMCKHLIRRKDENLINFVNSSRSKNYQGLKKQRIFGNTLKYGTSPINKLFTKII